ncbi:MAG: hypothetical protein DIZ79_15170, partial [endosymbiont of Lamellibrachia luymesi]
VTITKGFGFIENFEITSSGREREVKRKDGETLTKKTVLGFEVTLSEWIFNALMAKEALQQLKLMSRAMNKNHSNDLSR